MLDSDPVPAVVGTPMKSGTLFLIFKTPFKSLRERFSLVRRASKAFEASKIDPPPIAMTQSQ